MAITRIDCSERGISWLSEFADKLATSDIDYLKQHFEGTQKFSSVEEKLDDIKERIGFSILKNSGDTESEQVKIASARHPEAIVKKMGDILSYIESMVAAEPHLSWGQVLNRCREEELLGFKLMPINLSALKAYTEKLLSESSKDNSEESVKYVNREDEYNYNKEDDMAEYYKHSIVD